MVGVSVTVLNVLTCTAAGYSFSKFHYPGRNLAFSWCSATLMVPLEILYVPLYKLVFDLGWVNSFAGLIIPAGDERVRDLPHEAGDRFGARRAARGGPAGWRRRDCARSSAVVAPAVRGPMAALALFVFMMNWDSYFWPLLVASDEEHRTLPVGLAAMQSNNLGAAGVPVILMAAPCSRCCRRCLLFLVPAAAVRRGGRDERGPAVSVRVGVDGGQSRLRLAVTAQAGRGVRGARVQGRRGGAGRRDRRRGRHASAATASRNPSSGRCSA